MPDVKKRMVYIMPALGIGVLLAAADQTIIVSSYGKIGSDLNALSQTSWIATAYFLTLTSFQPLYGKLSDIFGRKQCLLFAYIIFGLGCLFCGLAQNMTQLIIARAVAGVGGGGMTTVVSILLSDVVSLRERGTWQGYVNIIYASGAAAGAPLGGILSDTIGWQWAFLAQTPLCAVAFIAVSLMLNLPAIDESHWKEKFRRIDFLGAVTLLSAVVCLVFGVDRGGNMSWTDKLTLATLVASVFLFILFSIVEVYFAPEPFTPGRIIFERTLFAAYLCNFFSFAGHMAALFFVQLIRRKQINCSKSSEGGLPKYLSQACFHCLVPCTSDIGITKVSQSICASVLPSSRWIERNSSWPQTDTCSHRLSVRKLIRWLLHEAYRQILLAQCHMLCNHDFRHGSGTPLFGLDDEFSGWGCGRSLRRGVFQRHRCYDFSNCANFQRQS